MRLVIERRLNVPRWLEWVAPVVALVAALLVIALIFLLLGVNPLIAYQRIFTGAFGSAYGLSESVVKAIPLLLCGAGLVLAFRAGIYNIGAEGQLLIGAVCATGMALTFPHLPAEVLLPAMFIAGFLGGALWGVLPAWLRVRYQVNEVITTLMMVYIASELVNFLVYGPWRAPEELGFPYSAKFSASAQLPRLFLTRIHYPTLILAVLFAVLIHIVLTRTRLGYEIRVTGENPAAARYAGMDYWKVVVLVMIISGGLAGLAGVGEVAGIQHRLRYPQGISPGYGFTAIIVAWLARLNPLVAILTAFLLGGLLVGGDAIQVVMGLPVATIYIFNGIILLFVLSSDVLTRYRIRWVRS
jgi:simple sugar transport system permease protein